MKINVSLRGKGFLFLFLILIVFIFCFSQFLIEALTKIESMLMHLHAIFLEMWSWISNTEYTLYVYVDCICIIHACWCNGDTSSHSRGTLSHLGQWQRWSSSMMTRNLFRMVPRNSDVVCKFAICSMLVRFEII